MPVACILAKESRQTKNTIPFVNSFLNRKHNSTPYHLYITDASLPTPLRREKRIRRQHFKSALNRLASWQRRRKKQKQMVLCLARLHLSVLRCANIKGPLTLGTVIVRCYIQSLWYVLNISVLQLPIFQRSGRNCRAASLKLVQRKEALFRERSKPLSNEKRDTCVKFKWAG